MADPIAIPDSAAVLKAADLDILDVKGDKIKFGSIFEKQKVVVVFIRHFFCGSCQAYVEHLAKVRDETLSSAGASIVVIGCGEWNPIKFYAETTGFKGAIYADPSRKLYRALGMTLETLAQTPAGQERRSYLTLGPLSNALRSIWRGLTHAQLIGKQGNLSQLGGDFVFGPGKECTFAHRMQHTEDHIEVPELMEIVGVEYP